MQDKSLISAQNYCEKKIKKHNDFPIKNNTFIFSDRLYIGSFNYRKKTYYNIFVAFKNSYWPISCIQFNQDKKNNLFIHESRTYVAHVITELDRLGSISLKVNNAKKYIFLDEFSFSSYYFHSVHAAYFIHNVDLIAQLFRDMFIDSQFDLSKHAGKPLHHAQAVRLNEVKSFYYEKLEGEYINEITDNFQNAYFLTRNKIDYYDVTARKKAEDGYKRYFNNNVDKAVELFFSDKAKSKKIISFLDNLSSAQRVVLTFSSTFSFVIWLYSLLENKTSEFVFSAEHATFLRNMIEYGEYTSFIQVKSAGERKQLGKDIEKRFEGMSFVYTAGKNFINMYSAETDKIFLETLIAAGESKTVEFKATAKYSINKKADDKHLYFEIIRAICALANTDGGTLLVGYDEKNKSYCGIERDGFKNFDAWENYVRNHLDRKAGQFVGTLILFDYKKYKNRTLAVINVERSTKRILCKDIKSDHKSFYVRTGAYTKALNIDEAIKYVANRFNT
jgi:hypothetical protein